MSFLFFKKRSFLRKYPSLAKDPFFKTITSIQHESSTVKKYTKSISLTIVSDKSYDSFSFRTVCFEFHIFYLSLYIFENYINIFELEKYLKTRKTCLELPRQIKMKFNFTNCLFFEWIFFMNFHML